MTDERIIELFFARSDEALEAVTARYGDAMYRISHNILQNEEDAKECVNDAYLALWNAIPPARPDPLGAFAYRICRNISLTRYKHDRAAKRDRRGDVSFEELADVLSDDTTPEWEWEPSEAAQALNDFLGRLDATNLYVFMRRYWFCDAVGDIARAAKLSEAAVYLRLSRMKKSLAKFLKKRGMNYEES